MNHRKYSPRAQSPHYNRRPLRPNEAPYCRVYVIELPEFILGDPAFRKANPNYVFGMLCVYVGCTSLKNLEERFQQHVGKIKNSSRIASYGLRLRMDLVDYQKPLRRTLAMDRERRLARELRSRGYGVWQA